MSFFWAWLRAFAFTQIIEVPIYRRALDGRTAVAFGASLITHPIVWLASIPLSPKLGLWPYIALAELFAWLVEAGYMHLFGLKRALMWSAIANGASFGLGTAAHYLLPGSM